MPTYEYRCKECAHEFDAVQAFTDEALTECPECQGALRKVFGNVGITFKGSGFYKNDSRSSSGSPKGDKSESTASETKSESSETKSESSKPEPKKVDTPKKTEPKKAEAKSA